MRSEEGWVLVRKAQDWELGDQGFSFPGSVPLSV